MKWIATPETLDEIKEMLEVESIKGGYNTMGKEELKKEIRKMLDKQCSSQESIKLLKEIHSDIVWDLQMS